MVKSVRALLLEHILYKNNNKQLVPIILHNSKANKYLVINLYINFLNNDYYITKQ